MKPERAQLLTQGLLAGLVGYAVVAVFFAVSNLVAGRSPLWTAAALGSALLYGMGDTANLTIEPGPVLAFNGVHLFLSIIAGTVAAWLLYETERHHFIWYFVLMIFLGAFVFSLVVVGVIGAEMSHIVSWWSVLTANLLWLASMCVFLWMQHRSLFGDIQRESESST